MNVIVRARKALGSRLWRLIARVTSLRKLVWLLQLKLTKETFDYDSVQLAYVFHSHNNMGLSERTVELAIARHYLQAYRPTRLLEVGNVTAYYYDVFRGLWTAKDVVDLGESDCSVHQQDIATFHSDEKYDFILSVSTFEHMDEDPDRGETIVMEGATAALRNIKYCYTQLLAEKGTMVVTAALGWESEWDRTFFKLLTDECGFHGLRKLLFRRTGEQAWQEVTPPYPQPMPYGEPYPFGNWLSVVEIRK